MNDAALTKRAGPELEFIGFGGGCHWCTEAVFQSLRGVVKVEQGWIRSIPPHETESEAVVVHFRPEKIDLVTLIEMHQLTHASTSDHSMRGKYRSAIYTFNAEQWAASERTLGTLGAPNGKNYVTKVLPFVGFRLNEEDFLDYYRTRPDAPFCQTYIDPKLRALRQKFGDFVTPDVARGPSAAESVI